MPGGWDVCPGRQEAVVPRLRAWSLGLASLVPAACRAPSPDLLSKFTLTVPWAAAGLGKKVYVPSSLATVLGCNFA